MVKERRDMTVQSKENSRLMGYTNIHTQDSKPTAYDIFREKKAESARKTSSVNCAGTCAYMEAPAEKTFSDVSYFAPKISVAGETASSVISSKTVECADSRAVKQNKMTKNGKLLIALYVLIVGVIAFIILSANALNIPAAAIAEGSEEDSATSIAAMDLESEVIAETNWFDSLLDGLDK